METAITFIREWISTIKSRHTNDGSKNYGDIDETFSEGVLLILTEDISREEAVEQLDTLFASSWDYKHPRYMDLYLDVRNMVQPEMAEIEEEECPQLIGTSQ